MRTEKHSEATLVDAFVAGCSAAGSLRQRVNEILGNGAIHIDEGGEG